MTTQSNASSTGITLTEANLETAMNAIRAQLSDTGGKLNIGINNLKLMVPFALEKEAVIIVQSDGRSGTANNDTNWYRGKIDVLVHPFLDAATTDLDGNTGSDTAWFLFAQGVHGLKFVWEENPLYKMWEDEDNDAMYTKVYFSCRPLFDDWRGFWGSKGDGAAYSS